MTERLVVSLDLRRATETRDGLGEGKCAPGAMGFAAYPSVRPMALGDRSSCPMDHLWVQKAPTGHRLPASPTGEEAA